MRIREGCTIDASLNTFIAVADFKSFTRAAEELHMTQPAVSQHIRALEGKLGARLLERTNKVVRLTRAGEIVYYHAREIAGHYARMQRLVDDLSNKAAGTIAIGASYTFGEYILPRVVADMRRAYPLITPSIAIGNTADVAEMVLDHRADIGVVEGQFHHDALLIEPLEEDEMWIAAPGGHRLAGEGTANIEQLAQETWILREQGSGTREATDAMFEQFGLHPADRLELGSTQAIKEAVEAGLGVTLLSRWAVRKEVAEGSLVLLALEGFPVTRKFSAITRKEHFCTKAMDVFMAMLRERREASGMN